MSELAVLESSKEEGSKGRPVGGWRRKIAFVGIFTLILITFTLQLLSSLSTAIITPLDLIHAELVPGRGDGIPRRISLGGSGGCMWFDDLSGPPTKCITTIHFQPDPEVLSLSEEDTILSAMTTKIGVWRITNYLATGLVGMGKVLFVLSGKYGKLGGITSAILYPATLLTWAALIGDISYLLIVQRNVRTARPRFHAELGLVIWLWVVSTALVSVTACLIVWYFESTRAKRFLPREKQNSGEEGSQGGRGGHVV
ncbi:hypothetical protein I302_102229 [Kwoniella bestiolae CBS 10118]|uniref:Uncharacterized protein n=1 Tax=Kwoniella bestiolae CBS 10118 TaxID=1296100 RepID=A0A1B9GED1_9TREE|nr:hypothetical protein I302_00918 [Kwoniella bestiolae CBS 10118]OCF29413.1 hypothetical protein I302_00918 [Kwoniella bestiolae CBS 10118]